MRFKRSPGRIPEGLEDCLFTQEYVQAHRMQARRCLNIMGLPTDSRILDIGCGTAGATVPLSVILGHVIGLDISTQMLNVARKRARLSQAAISLVVADMLRLPFEKASFDGIACMDVTFGYFGPDGDLQQVREMGRCLRPGGRLFIETFDKQYGMNNPGAPDTGQYWGTYNSETDRFTGLNLYSPGQWRRMLSSAGMKILRVLSADDYSLSYMEYCQGHQFIIILASRQQPYASSHRLGQEGPF